MEFFINIEDAAGVRLGDGPITSALEWRFSPELDGAGEFSFRMPANDPKARVVANRRIARCWGILGGVLQELGAGIIDSIEYEANDPSLLRVSGPDLLAELATRTVGALTVKAQDWRALTDPTRGMLAWFRVETDNASVTLPIEIPQAHDGNAGTYETIRIRSSRSGYPESRYYLYVGYDARFDRVRFTFHGGVINTVISALRMQYYNGEAWIEHAITDGTRVYDAGLGGWVTWNTNGDVTFTRPADWSRYTAAYGAGNWFWVRFYLADAAGSRVTSDSVRLTEVQVYADVPTTDGINQIMAYAPATWTRTGYPQTVNASYLEFDGESVLTALVTLAEQGGQSGGSAVREHFRLGAGRAVAWLGTTWPASGFRAIQGTGDPRLEDEDGVCLIAALTEKRDSAELVTRLYPRSSDGVPVTLTSRSAPAGYTLSKAGNYIERDASVAAYGVIEGWLEFSAVGLQQPDSFTEHPGFAADQVFDRALEVLRARGVPGRFYDLDVMGAQARILPGTTIHVVYREALLDGGVTADIDADLYITSSTFRVDEDGVCTVGLAVASIDREPRGDADVLATSIRDGRRSGSASVAIASTIVHTEAAPPSGEATITGGTIDNVIIGGSVPRTGYFTYLHANVGGQIAGWTIEPGRLISNNVGLYASGYIAAGLGDQTVRISGQGTDTYRLWVGNQYAELAPFRVSQDGYLEASDVTISGDVTAETGELQDLSVTGELELSGDGVIQSGNWAVGVSGWRINSAGQAEFQDATLRGHVEATTGELVDLDVTGLLELSDGGVIQSGNFASGLSGWQIDAAGQAEFQDATLRGHVEAETGELGDLDVTGLLELSAGGTIQSSNYSANLRGWRITHEGDAEFENARVRGRIQTAVFEHDQISANAGTILVTPTAGALEGDFTTDALDSDVLVVQGDAWVFETGDVVRIRALDVTGAVAEAWLEVTRTATLNEYTVEHQSGDYATWPAGTAVVGYGGSGSLLLTASLTGAPHYSVRTHGASPWQDESEVVRIGNMDGSYGISDEDYGMGLGDYASGEYLRFTPSKGLELSASQGSLAVDDKGISFILNPRDALSPTASRASILFYPPAGGGVNVATGSITGLFNGDDVHPELRDSAVAIAAIQPAGEQWREAAAILSAYNEDVGVMGTAYVATKLLDGDAIVEISSDDYVNIYGGTLELGTYTLSRRGRTCRILVDSNHIQTPATVSLTTSWATVLYFDLIIPTLLTGTILAQATLNCLCNSFTSSTNIFARLLIDGQVVQSIHGEWSRVWERVSLPVFGRASGLAAGTRRVAVQVNKGSANAGGYVIAAEGFLMAQAYA